MARAVVYTFLFAAFIVFVIFSPTKQRRNQSIEGLISRRLGHKFHPPAFDPLVTRMERLSREKDAFSSNRSINVDAVAEKEALLSNRSVHVDAATKEPVNEDMFEEYFAKEGRLNTTMRIKFLFPLLDSSPRDGFVSLKELQTWMMQQTEDNMGYRTAKELDLRDKDRDGSISFQEYFPQFSKEDIEKNEKGHGEAGWWKDQFKNADFDHNGSLDIEEFNNFLHPEDSRNGDIQRWVLKERIRGMDTNGDGKLDYKEFVDQAYEMYKEFAKFEIEDDHVTTSQLLFAELDKDRDRFLIADELRPIMRYLHPGELSYAKYYSSFLFNEADDDKDGNLSLEEMLNHEDVFYKAVHDDEDGEDDDFDHDEL